MQLAHAARAMRAVTMREITKFVQQAAAGLKHTHVTRRIRLPPLAIGNHWRDSPLCIRIVGQPVVSVVVAIHQRGVVTNEPGMYFVGLHFLYSMTSATLMGVGRDANHVVKNIQLRARAHASQVVEHTAQVKAAL